MDMNTGKSESREKGLLPVLLVLLFFCSGAKARAAESGEYKIRLTVNEIVKSWDTCDSRKWVDGFGAVTSEISTVTFNGRDCIRVYYSTGNYGVIRVDEVFYKEDWRSPISSFSANVYVQGSSTANIKLEVYSSTAGAFPTGLMGAITSSDLTENAWNNLSWPVVDISSHAAIIKLIPQNLPATPTTFYIDALKLGTTIWDTMANETHEWYYDNDASTWNARFDRDKHVPITHNNASTTTPAGCIYLEWNITDDGHAEVASDLNNEDWSAYTKIRADIYCSSTNVDIDMVFYDGWNWLGSGQKRVSAANTWETLTWSFPAGTFDWDSLNRIIFRTDTTDEANGTLYIDDIKLVK
ncbi:MAG: hypothetical protein JXJ19_01650 [Elusimicrobia bacterium]|nr:hypothetical protein [Elusimicrobiota bacterium]